MGHPQLGASPGSVVDARASHGPLLPSLKCLPIQRSARGRSALRIAADDQPRLTPRNKGITQKSVPSSAVPKSRMSIT